MTHHHGNRPDCAYFLLLGVALAAFFLALGGVCTYVAFWPEIALTHDSHHNSARVTYQIQKNEKYQEATEVPISSETDQTDLVKEAERNAEMKIIGPICLSLGLFVLIIVGVYAIKYRCDYEPEEPNIAFLRLASELSLNFDPERNKYRLMRTTRPTEQEFPLDGFRADTSTCTSSSNLPKY